MATGEGKKMTEARRQDEKRRREEAQAHQGQVIEGSGKALEGRRLDQMVSLRLDPEILASLRALAGTSGRSVSDLLRVAAARLVASTQMTPVAFRVTDVVGTASGGLSWAAPITYPGIRPEDGQTEERSDGFTLVPSP